MFLLVAISESMSWPLKICVSDIPKKKNPTKPIEIAITINMVESVADITRKSVKIWYLVENIATNLYICNVFCKIVHLHQLFFIVDYAHMTVNFGTEGVLIESIKDEDCYFGYRRDG